MSDDDKQKDQVDIDQDKQGGEPEARYVDPNSGAAPQPGGFVMQEVVDEEGSKPSDPQPEDRDSVRDATIETQAGPAGEQPGGDLGPNAAEDGTTETQQGDGNASTGDGSSDSQESSSDSENKEEEQREGQQSETQGETQGDGSEASSTTSSSSSSKRKR